MDLEPLLDEIEGRRKRALREILTVHDELIVPHVDARAARDLRAIIVDQVNALAYLAANQVRRAGPSPAAPPKPAAERPWAPDPAR